MSTAVFSLPVTTCRPPGVPLGSSITLPVMIAASAFKPSLVQVVTDSNKRVTWNALFSPRWLPLSARSTYTELGAMQPTRTDGGRPRIIVTPATSSPDFAGVSFQKTVIVMARQQGKVVVRHVYNFHQSTEEAWGFPGGCRPAAPFIRVPN
ncbi:BTB/POZ domain-containing protein 17 [Larimichthys crocea]|uniref:Uncharacterized protein n=1 Tax=Larimichthys crocea TaxID=215358 RepID=A0ACD3R793_LARCR|nr:BTB/POZ domain-containing protein 17 [Larimichthys crocea]